jgi:hypothetical protein
MKVKIDNYSFDKATRKITFSDYATIRLDGVLLITNVTSNVIIYNFSDSTLGGSVTNNVLTLTYDTTSMNNSDKLLIYYDDNAFDGKLLSTVDVSTAAPGSAIDTAGYGSTVCQISGNWEGNIYFEASNDGTYWDMVFIISRDEASLQDTVDCNGTYSIKRSGRYLRYNVQQIIGTAHMTFVGRIGEGLSGADFVSFAMDRTQKMPLQVQLPADLKQEPDGGLYIADMKGPLVWGSSNVNQPLTIDCTGFESVIVHKITAGIVTPTVSNDGTTWSATLAVPVSTGLAAATMPAAVGIYVLPVTSKYLRLTGPASVVQCFIYLSMAPCVIVPPNAPFNLAQVAGTPPPTANVAGTIVVGGPVQTGVAPTTFPLPIAGVDSLPIPLTRRVLTDVYGRLQIGNIPSQTNKGINVLGFDPAYRNPLEVQETSLSEGMGITEMLNMILVELRILNQQLYELPGLQMRGVQSMDPPEAYRQDPSLFEK